MTSYDDIAIGGTDTAQPLAVEARLQLLERLVPLAGKRVIDCGCGAGGYVRALLDRGVDAFGVEYDADKVAHYHQTAPEPDRVEVGDLAALRFASASFDVAILNEVLEHVPDERAALREIRRILRPGGTLVVFSPNRLYPFETHGVIRRSTGAFVPLARTLLVPYVPVRLGKHVFEYVARNYWPYELRRLVTGAELSIVHTAYLWQTFENISGTQPSWIRALVPVLRRASSTLARIPGIRALGVSQVIVATRS